MDQMDFFGQSERLPAISLPDGVFNSEAVSHRVRTLLLTSPIHSLERNKVHRSDMHGVDVRSLALIALDLAIEGMGLDEGISKRELIDRLGQLAPKFIGEAPGEQFAEICGFVVDGLMNAPRGEVFSEEYLYLEGEPHFRDFQFRLLQEEERDGRVVLRASKYGINLCLRMLETEVEDAQIANEAVLEDQLRRGAIDRAVHSAQQARLLSVALEEKIELLIHRLSRDVQQVDFIADLKPQLDEARGHLSRRSDVSQRILQAVEERLDEAYGEPGKVLAQLRKTLQDCRSRHAHLANRVMSTTRRYLDEQERQAFRRARSGRLPAMEAEVMKPAVMLPCRHLEPMAQEIISLMEAPAPPLVLSFSGLIDFCSAPKRQVSDMQAEIDDDDCVEVAPIIPRWSDEEYMTVAACLSKNVAEAGPEGLLLSRLLDLANNEGWSPGLVRLLTLEALRIMEDSDDCSSRLSALPAGEPFSRAAIGGDDLRILFREADS